MSDLLTNIVCLSKRFGTPAYVTAGGGNSSAKDEETLWVKPSGCSLPEMEATDFVAMDRKKLSLLGDVAVSGDPDAREARAKEIVINAMREGSSGRPSVETPLHNIFRETYVMHTHPVLVNGMTCAVDGAATCARLFPEALWMPYIDPGITIYHAARDMIAEYEEKHGAPPQVVFIKNHGLFVACDTPAEMIDRHEVILGRLSDEYEKLGISTSLPETRAAPAPDDIRVIKDTLPAETAETIITAAPFDIDCGPPAPDHVVYMKALAHIGELSGESVEAFKARNGYWPRVLVTETAAYAVGPSAQNARVAMESAREAALVKQLAEAFGGLDCLTPESTDFIDNWEAESYRRKLV